MILVPTSASHKPDRSMIGGRAGGGTELWHNLGECVPWAGRIRRQAKGAALADRPAVLSKPCNRGLPRIVLVSGVLTSTEIPLDLGQAMYYAMQGT